MFRSASLALTALLFPTASAWACWIDVPIDQVALDSDAIVVGRLVDVHVVQSGVVTGVKRRWMEDEVQYRGRIEIERVLWLAGPQPRSLDFSWSAMAHGVRSTDIAYGSFVGERMLWLVKLDRSGSEPGLYRAGHPKQSIPLHNRENVMLIRNELRRTASKDARVTAIKDVVDQLVRDASAVD